MCSIQLRGGGSKVIKGSHRRCRGCGILPRDSIGFLGDGLVKTKETRGLTVEVHDSADGSGFVV